MAGPQAALGGQALNRIKETRSFQALFFPAPFGIFAWTEKKESSNYYSKIALVTSVISAVNNLSVPNPVGYLWKI